MLTIFLLQTEHAAAELLARGFGQKFQTDEGSPPSAAGDGNSLPLSPSSAAAITNLSLPTIRTTTSSQRTSLRPSGGSLPAQPHNNGSLSSPRSRQTNSFRPQRGSRGMLTPTAAAAAAAGTSSSGLHPVVRLGWKPLCSVVCNGLRGEFLGGHDRDMFMKVTSGHYAGLPLIDVSLGGCIMTCSQFERYAGRELSKKWKESIHVVGEGEGSRATLLSWLKRKAEQDFGAGVVGKKIWVCWCADAEYYLGTIVSYNKEGGKHTVQYSSRLSEDLHLAVEMISFDTEKPTVPAAAVGGAGASGAGAAGAAAGLVDGNSSQQQQQQQLLPQGPAASAPAGGERAGMTSDGVAFLIPSHTNAAAAAVTGIGNTIGGAMAVQSPLWHQGSGISVTSSYGDELRGNAALIAMASGARGGNVSGIGVGGSLLRTSGQRRGGGAKIGSDGEGNPTSPRSRRKPVHREDDTAMPPPKRALSAPAAVLLAEAAAAAAAMAAEEQHTASPGILHQKAHTLGLLLSSSSPLPLPVPSLMLPLPPPPPLGALSAAASADPSSEALSAAVGWMHDVALCLDTELENTERERRTATTVTSTGAAGRSPPTPPPQIASPSGRFQALLGLLRGTPACLYGIFESMIRRYNHFAGIPQLQRQKLVELMLATLIEAAAPRDLFKSLEAQAAEAANLAAPAAKTAENAEIRGIAAATDTAAAAGGGQTPTPMLTTSPSPSLLNNAKNNNFNNNDDHQGHLKMGIDDEEAYEGATIAR